MTKKILIIAEPNGAGKTTFGKEFLPNEASCPAFENADLSGAEAALRRAALRAKEKAEAHGLKVLVYSEKEPKE